MLYLTGMENEKTKQDPALFWSAIPSVNIPNTCWIYPRKSNKDGDCSLFWDGTYYVAQDLAWLLTHGEKPYYVGQKCSVRQCVNPGHLYSLSKEEYQQRTFWNKVTIKGPKECWDWKGQVKPGKHPYGKQEFNGKMYSAHRLSYYYTHGHFAEVTMHICDRPICVSPYHLVNGTNKENTLDMIIKGRRPKVFGSAHKNARINEDQVIEMRKAYTEGKKSGAQIAAEFKISPGHVMDIIKGNKWKHVPMFDLIEGSLVRRGEQNKASVLNDDKVRKIRELYGKVSVRHLAEMFGVSKPTIVEAAERRTWKHVE